MKSFKYIAVLLLACVLLSSVAVAEDKLAVLDKALEFVVSYDYGQEIKYAAPVNGAQVDMLLIERKASPGSNPLLDLESIVFHLGPDSELRGAVEAKLIAALKAAKTDTAKQILCRHLQVVGTDKSVAVLGSLLTDDKVAHMARYALARMEGSEASEALYRGLGKASSTVKAGIINDLSDRGYAKAKKDVMILVNSEDATVAKAAVRGLGVFGGKDSVKALQSASENAEGAMGLEIDNSLLNCAAKYVADGKDSDAEKIYEDIYANSGEKQFKLAGLQGLLMASGEDAAAILVNTIKNDDSIKLDAIVFISMVKGEKATDAFISMLDSLPDELKSKVILAMGGRGESGAASALAAYTKHGNRDVRIAALTALGNVGDASTVVVLIDAAKRNDQAEKSTAKASLLTLKGEDVDAKLDELVAEGDVGARVEVLKVIGSRGSGGISKNVMAATKDPEKRIRLAAIHTVGYVATAEEVGVVAKLAVSASDSSELASVEKAVARVFAKIDDPDARAKPVLAEMKKANNETKAALLGLLSKSGSSKALATVVKAVANDNDTVAKAAIKALSKWQDAAAADALYDVIKNSDNAVYKSLALDGYVRLAGISENSFEMYRKAMEVASSPAEKKKVLSGLATCDDAGALDMALDNLGDDQVQAEAGLAAVRIAERLKGSDKEKARDAFIKVVATVKNDGIRNQAQEQFNGMTKFEDHIMKYWVAVGPFKENGLDARGVYGKAFAPENDFNAVEWKPLAKGIGEWSIDLHPQFGNLDVVGAYVRTTVISDVEQDVQIESGADDCVKIWLNGQQLHDLYREGGVEPRQVITKTKLKQGENTLIIKIVDNGGGWSFCSRIRKPDGSRLEGLKFEAR